MYNTASAERCVSSTLAPELKTAPDTLNTEPHPPEVVHWTCKGMYIICNCNPSPLGPRCTPKVVLVRIPRCTGTGQSSLLRENSGLLPPFFTMSHTKNTPPPSLLREMSGLLREISGLLRFAIWADLG